VAHATSKVTHLSTQSSSSFPVVLLHIIEIYFVGPLILRLVFPAVALIQEIHANSLSHRNDFNADDKCN